MKSLFFVAIILATTIGALGNKVLLPPSNDDAGKDDDNAFDRIIEINAAKAGDGDEETFTLGGEGDNKKDIKLWEADIVLTDKLKDSLEAMKEGNSDAFDAITNGRWSNNQVPYVFASGFRYRSVVQQAMADYHRYTCLKFRPKTSRDRNYVYFMHGGGCYSMIGMQGGRQQISLGNGCGTKGVAIHEMMHAAGFFHEQSRLDRDSYIVINWSNINRQMWYNFQKYKRGQASTLGAGYDKSSIMHYGNYAFSINRQKTIVSKANSGETLGQRRGFSKIDIYQLNKYYGCSKTTTTTTKRPTSSCSDNHSFCSQLSSCCSNRWISYNCKKTCRKCPPPRRTTPKPSSSCKDLNRYCTSWAKGHANCGRGSCCYATNFKKYMSTNCRKACGICR